MICNCHLVMFERLISFNDMYQNYITEYFCFKCNILLKIPKYRDKFDIEGIIKIDKNKYFISYKSSNNMGYIEIKFSLIKKMYNDVSISDISSYHFDNKYYDLNVNSGKIITPFHNVKQELEDLIKKELIKIVFE